DTKPLRGSYPNNLLLLNPDKIRIEDLKKKIWICNPLFQINICYPLYIRIYPDSIDRI
ncbi:24433_t:CDS:2, partial [Racocetra persica]